MSVALNTTVFVYAGHRIALCSGSKRLQTVEGPYGINVEKHLSTFQKVNALYNKFASVQRIYGDQLVESLFHAEPSKTLLVIPAGESSNLDRVFSDQEIAMIKARVSSGMELYAECGSAYWLAKERVWDVKQAPLSKEGRIGIFPGVAAGPLSPYPEQPTHAAFVHEGVELKTARSAVRVLLSGGGAFFVPENEQRVETLAVYNEEFLQQRGKGKEWEKAVISCSYGKGKAILSMVHPDFGPEDLDVDIYARTFSDRTDDWKAIRDFLSPQDARIQFIAEILGVQYTQEN